MSKKNMEKKAYDRKIFGEVSFKGSLDNYNQILRFEYLYPTEKYTGKFAMTLITPNRKGIIEVKKPTPEQIDLWIAQITDEKLKDFLNEVKNTKIQSVGARSYNLNTRC